MSVQNSVEFNIDEDFGITEAIATLDNGDFGARTLRFETGQLARQADGSVTTYLDDDTMLLATTTASNQPREGFDFFPLTVDVEERMYAAGKIPGSFFRREGRPSSEAILACLCQGPAQRGSGRCHRDVPGSGRVLRRRCYQRRFRRHPAVRLARFRRCRRCPHGTDR